MLLRDKRTDNKIHYILWTNKTIQDIFNEKEKNNDIATKVTDKIVKTFFIETDVCLFLILIFLHLERKDAFDSVIARYVLFKKNEFNRKLDLFSSTKLKNLTKYNKKLYMDLLLDFSECVDIKDRLVEMWIDLIKWCRL